MSGISGISGSNAGALANLDLTQARQTQIQQILKNAQNQGLSPQQVRSQVNAVLTPVSDDGTDEFGIPTTLASASTTSAGTPARSPLLIRYSRNCKPIDDWTLFF